MSPEAMLARVLYRDALMLVIDKPAGQAVHPGPKGGPSLLDHFDALRFGLPRPPALAHRLDRDTSGCLVLGRHRKALAHLGVLFKHGRVRKLYWAVVEGGPDTEEGRIELPLGRLDATRGWWMKPDPKGQPAVTTWRVLGRALPLPACGERSAPKAPGEGGSPYAEPVQTPPHPDPLPASGERETASRTWLALEPLTGRTHQLRVHCAAMGWPIVGDAIYGTAPRTGGPPLHLHAREVVVPLYPKREPVQVVAPVPEPLRAALAACGWGGDEAALPATQDAAALSKDAP
ncbi:MAG TPA: RNA pseudouridine synthase [Xanthobacteraceae bacterium]|nr:RNA pseudouridine synthase [Xanthobacteraceae bacterium]